MKNSNIEELKLKIDRLKDQLNEAEETYLNARMEELKSKIDKVFHGRNYAFNLIRWDGFYKYHIFVKDISIYYNELMNRCDSMGHTWFPAKRKVEAMEYLNKMVKCFECEKIYLVCDDYNQYSHHAKLNAKILEENNIEVITDEEYGTIYKNVIAEDKEVWSNLVNEYNELEKQLKELKAA